MMNGRSLRGSFHRALVLLLISVTSLLPQNLSLAAEQPKRPRIGLVLGGGGAKGAAHIGVLKVLDELRVPVDCIAGTSMGAVVGSLYASGMSADEIEKTMMALDWADLFTDKPPRSEIDFVRKREDWTVLASMELGVKDGKVRSPRAIIAAQKIGLLFETLLMPVSEIRDFDKLSTPYRAVAADLETGEAVVLKSGKLADAAKASMSVPGVFPPAEVSGRFLTDGGIVRNLPVDVARKMCADIVIAVDVATPLPQREELGSPPAILNQMVSIMMQDNVQHQIDSLTTRDVFIHPDLGPVGSGDFQKGKEAIERGVKAALGKTDELRKLSVTKDEYAAYRERHRSTPPRTMRVGKVTIEGLERVSPLTVQSKLEVLPGQEISVDHLKHQVGMVYGMGDFERVALDAERRGDVYDLKVVPQEKSWGPNYLRWGMSLSSSLQGDSDYNILADYTRRWVNGLGAEWKTQAQFGSYKVLQSEFYQPLEHSRTFFVAPRVSWQQRLIDVYQGDQIVGEYRLRKTTAGLDLGMQPWSYGEIRLGYEGGYAKQAIYRGTLAVPRDDVGLGAFRGRVVADQLDNPNFPHTGYFGVIDYYAALPGVGADDRYRRIDARFSKAFTYDAYTLLAGARYGSYVNSELPPYDLLSLGGFLNLSGYQKDQLYGQKVGFGRLVAYWRASQTLLGNFYLGGSFEAGNVWQRNESAAFNDLLYAGSVFLGYDTPLGPLYIAVGAAEGGHTTLYVYLGKVFY
jgi:NTE family protein